MKIKAFLFLIAFAFFSTAFTKSDFQADAFCDCKVYLNYYRSDGSVIGTWQRCAKPGEACGESINIKYR